MNPNGYCYADLPAGGYPFAWLYDSPATSVVGRLGAEDVLTNGGVRLAPLIADVVLYFLLFAVIWFLAVRRWQRGITQS